LSVRAPRDRHHHKLKRREYFQQNESTLESIGTYQEHAFPRSRIPTIDTLDQGLKKHHVPVLVELDVTKPREIIRHLKQRTGEGLSFTGWMIKCVGQAVGEHKHVHAMRKGKSKMIVFDDVDVAIPVERITSNVPSSSETLPMPYVIRRTNQKTIREIHSEIRAAQSQPLEKGDTYLTPGREARMTRIFTSLPKFLRDLVFWRRIRRDPFFVKKWMGTVIVTSVGMFGKASGSSWAIPIGIHPLIILLGGIATKPGVVNDRIEIREYLSMTILFDHDVTDGAPVARFLQRLKELIESGYGLAES